jgi:hypothetical protein
MSPSSRETVWLEVEKEIAVGHASSSVDAPRQWWSAAGSHSRRRPDMRAGNVSLKGLCASWI